MDEEIDIEEHDVLEDPRLRNIFPDISQIKVEIPDDDFEDQSMDYDPYSDVEENANHQEPEDLAEYSREGNKIILGSKPNTTASKVSENVDNTKSIVFGANTVAVKTEPNAGTITGEEEEYGQSSSVIIIGSKPCKTGVIEPISVNDTVNFSKCVAINKPLDDVVGHNSEENYAIKDSVVLLENWGPMLQNSSCFCKECEILFPTTNTLLAHKNITHSLLVVVDKNKAVKSTAKKQGAVDKNKAVKSTAKKQDVTSGKFCNHCNKMFPNSDSLINHLYENMTVKNTAKSTASTVKSNIKPNPINQASEALTFKNNIPTPRVIENKPQEHTSGSITTYSYKYKCVVCSEIFLNYAKARNHRILKHPELSGHNILKKMTYSSKAPSVAIKTVHPLAAPKSTVQLSPKLPLINIPKPTTTKLSEISPSKPAEGQLTISQALVPISVLFKCDRCDIHFTSCNPAKQHAKSCPKKPGEWTCEICQLQFKSWGRVMHNLQHKYSDKFSVYTCTENIEGKVLNNCPDCNTYLHEKAFFMHRSSGQPCQKKIIKCNLCTLPIHSTSAKEHKKWHATIKMNVKDMILVKFMKTDEVKVATGPVKRQLQMDETPIAEPKKAGIEVVENRPKLMKTDEVKVVTGSVKRQLQMNETLVSEPKKAKIDVTENSPNKLLVYYCKTCSSFTFHANTKSFHLAGQCKTGKYHRVVCKICGLICQSSHANKKSCQRVKGNLSDMKFVSVKGNQVIRPPIPQYPKCRKCQVHFCSLSSVSRHDCKESYKTCNYCKEKFSDLAHKLHVKFHLLQWKSINPASGSTVKLPKPAKDNLLKVKVPNKSLMPDLLMKYQMLTNGLHILYLCKTCEIACNSYDKAIEHCQKHYNHMESYNVIVNPCEICGLKFDSTCYDEHMALHDQNQNLSKEFFHVIKYEYSRLFHKEWNNILSELPAAQAQKILATSIYRYGKSFKLTIVKEGPPAATLYKCGKCNTFVHPSSIKFHYRTLACDKATYKLTCRYCGIAMSTVNTRKYHEKLHRMYSEFQIVHFNEEGDEEFNKNLREHGTRKKQFSNLGKDGFFNFFVCEKCKCCIIDTTSCRDHRCAKISQRTRCTKCQLYFSTRIISKHMRLHETYPNLCRKNIKLTSFKPIVGIPLRNSSPYSPHKLSEPTVRDSADEKDVDLYKCGCGLHFTTLKAAEKHFELCKGNTGNTSREKCSKCGLLFDTTQLVTHLCKHHSSGNEKNTKFKIAPLKKYCSVYVNGFMLFKCLKCNVHFLSHTMIGRHLKNNHLIIGRLATCSHCKLVFRPNSLNRHITQHHKSVKPTNIIKKDNVTIQRAVAKPSLKLKPGTGKKILKNLQKSGHELKKKYGKVLYQCRVCKPQTLFLSFHSLRSHYSRKSHNTSTEQCEECHYYFLAKGKSNEIHKYVHHKLRKLKREDFIIKVPGTKNEVGIQNSTEFDEPAPFKTRMLTEKPKHLSFARKSTTKSIAKLNTSKIIMKKGLDDSCSASNDSTSKQDTAVNGKRKYKFFNVLFKCDICESHFCTGKQVTKHIQDIHVKKGAASSSVELCHCGLIFNKYLISRHQQMHHEKQDLTAADFYIVPVNRYEDIIGHKHLFRCSVCKIHHMKLARLEEHMNNVEHYLGNSRCPKCHLAFLPSTLTAHIALHHDVLDISIVDYVIMESVGDDSVTLVDGIEQETTRYEQSSFTDTRQNCQINRFPKIKYTKHVEKQLKSKDMYDRTNLYNENTDIESIEKQIHKLADTSITEAASEYLTHLKGAKVTSEPTEKVKIQLMHLYKEKLYKCSVCDTNFIYLRQLQKHIKNKKACPVNNVVCLICDLKIAVNCLIIHVKFQHKMLNLAREDFVITDSSYINDDLSIVYGSCESHDESVIDSEKDDISILSKDDSISTINKDDTDQTGELYRCTTCSCNFLCYKSLRTHCLVHCKDDLKIYKCHVCQLLFTKKSLTKHMKRDHLTSTKVCNISPRSTLNKSNAENSPSSSRSHSLTPKPDPDRGRTNSVKKRLDESRTPEEFLLKLPDFAYSEIEVGQYNHELFKCHICPLHFFSEYGLRRHLLCYNYEEHQGCAVVTCKFCGIEFTGKLLAKHVYVHHVKLNISKNGYQIINSNGDRIKTSASIREIVDEDMVEASSESSDKVNRNACSEISLQDDSVFESAEEPKEIADKISTLNTDLYSNKLFKCNVCDLHFLTIESWHWHLKNAQHDSLKTHCAFCGLAFSVKTLPTHVFIHHDKLNLMKEHFLINCSMNDEVGSADEESEEISADETVINTKAKNNISKVASASTDNVESNTETVNENVATIHKIDTVEDHREVVEPADTAVINSKDSDKTSESTHENSSPKSDNSKPEAKKSSEKDDKIIKLYKCADCNVCFLNQTFCYKHVTKHIPLDSKDYIECKLCGYQFMIVNSLHKHIWKHHNRVFKPEDVLIEEYHPNILCHSTPKIEIYYGSDKVQSKLVSTTSEGNSSLEIDNQAVATAKNNVEVSDEILDIKLVYSSEDTQHAEDIDKDLNNESMDVDFTTASITIDE